VKQRMKLAPYSMWDGESVVDGDGSRCGIELLSAHPHAHGDLLTCAGSVYARNALAVIDAAGLDKVRAAARELRDYFYVHGGPAFGDETRARDEQFYTFIHALCRALDGEAETSEC
jgi:hypothetical protein